VTQSWIPEGPTTNFAGPVHARALYAGQSVAAVRSRHPAAEIVAELINEAETALSDLRVSCQRSRCTATAASHEWL